MGQFQIKRRNSGGTTGPPQSALAEAELFFDADALRLFAGSLAGNIPLSLSLGSKVLLFPSFSDNINNSPVVTKQALYLTTSIDGKKFGMLTASPIFNPGFLRDPSIIQDSTGKFWMVYTTGLTGTAFAVASSSDLLNWTLVANVDASSLSPYNTWAPEWFVDDDGSVHVFFAASTVGVNSGFQIYEVHPTNAARTSWSAPVLVTGTQLSPIDTIDPFVVKKNGTYYLWYKRYSGTPAIEYATSSSLLSGYDTGQTGDWAGWGDAYAEGPALIQMDSSTWRIYFDHSNVADSPNMRYSESTDDWATWSAPVDIEDPIRLKHGTPLVVADADSLRKMTLIALSRQGLYLGSGLWIRNAGGAGQIIYVEDADGNELFKLDVNGNATFDKFVTVLGNFTNKRSGGSQTNAQAYADSDYGWVGGLSEDGTYYLRMIQQGSAAAGSDLGGVAKAGNAFLVAHPASAFVAGTNNATPFYFTTNNVLRGSIDSTGKWSIQSLPTYPNNAAAVAGGLTAGTLYRTGGDPDAVCVVH